MLNIFYSEPDEDRWVAYDRYPRRLVRRLVRGTRRPGGHERVFLNLCAGLDRLGVNYRTNDFRFARENSEALVSIIGKSYLLDYFPWKNPILFGTAGYSHPIDDLGLLRRLPIKKILVPGPWMKTMCEPYWGDAVETWPVGIDTELWRPSPLSAKTIDVLIYDKVHWEHDRLERELIQPVLEVLRRSGRSFIKMQYGRYYEQDFQFSLAQCRTMVFLCEHETQGIAYQQALSCGVPILAWDRGGAWQDPVYYPDRVVFKPVTSVPYWDGRCGMRFADVADLGSTWDNFWQLVQTGCFSPRDYVMENLTLQQCAKQYLELAQSVGY